MKDWSRWKNESAISSRAISLAPEFLQQRSDPFRISFELTLPDHHQLVSLGPDVGEPRPGPGPGDLTAPSRPSAAGTCRVCASNPAAPQWSAAQSRCPHGSGRSASRKSSNETRKEITMPRYSFEKWGMAAHWRAKTIAAAIRLTNPATVARF